MKVITKEMVNRGTQDKGVVIVTGANRGIGRAITIELNKTGYTVIAGVRRTLKTDFQDHIEGVHYVSLDLTNSTSIVRFAEAAKDLCKGSLIALINNAGVSGIGPIEEFSLLHARQIFEVNFWGLIKLTQLLLPLLKKCGQRSSPVHLLNFGSLIAEFPVPYHAVYAASKGALRAYSLALRSELHNHNIKVVLVEPGDIATGTEPFHSIKDHSVYSTSFSQVKLARARKMDAALPPAVVARRIAHLLVSHNPPPIIALGSYARSLRFLRRIMPDRMALWLTTRSYGIRPPVALTRNHK